MKQALFSVIIALSRGAYFLLRHILPRSNSVVFLSRQSDSPSPDFRLLRSELRRQAPELKQRCFCRRMDGASLRDLLWLIKPTLALLRARGCFVDGQCIPLSLYSQRPGFVAVQVWHALGAIKKFGKQILDSPDGHSSREAKLWNMHAHYSFIPCASAATQVSYCEAFGYPPQSVPILGMPRVDELLRLLGDEESHGKIFAAHPTWRGMKKILYVPTFRKGKPLELSPLLKVLTPEKRRKYKLIVKVHPNDEAPAAPADVALTSIPTYELFAVADAIVTDYSAAAIEASLAGKPLYFYVPDLDEYCQSTGLNVHLEEEMPGAVFKDFAELMNAVESESYDYSALERFKEKYIETADTRNTERIVAEFLGRLG
ncbi:MAG: CDP-glycerol glycerophosphotransferase family protein [Clostridium sp.]|jgi:CDP-ribitol ribitolphosphotransferase|nr:CDP-glycerol glycerophosphotransferase family protein [Clostridium sp.]